jgi:Trypsin-co-occurring domain 2
MSIDDANDAPAKADNMQLGLVEAIDALRRDLVVAQRKAEEEKTLRFRLGPVEMEFLVEVTKEGKGEAGVKFWVVNVSAGGTLTRATTHRVTLTLHPYDVRTGEDASVADRDDG